MYLRDSSSSTSSESVAMSKPSGLAIWIDAMTAWPIALNLLELTRRGPAVPTALSIQVIVTYCIAKLVS